MHDIVGIFVLKSDGKGHMQHRHADISPPYSTKNTKIINKRLSNTKKKKANKSTFICEKVLMEDGISKDVKHFCSHQERGKLSVFTPGSRCIPYQTPQKFHLCINPRCEQRKPESNFQLHTTSFVSPVSKHQVILVFLSSELKLPI